MFILSLICCGFMSSSLGLVGIAFIRSNMPPIITNGAKVVMKIGFPIALCMIISSIATIAKYVPLIMSGGSDNGHIYINITYLVVFLALVIISYSIERVIREKHPDNYNAASAFTRCTTIACASGLMINAVILLSYTMHSMNTHIEQLQSIAH